MLRAVTSNGEISASASARVSMPTVSVAGRYIGWRTILVFVAELSWLLGSSVALVTLRQWVFRGPSVALINVAQVGTLSTLYLSIFYLMDLYDLDLVTPRRTLLLNLTQAVGLVCIAIALIERAGGLLFPGRWVLIHLLLTAAFMVTARTLIDRSFSRSRRLVHIGLVGGEAVRGELEREERALAHLRFGLVFVAETIEQARVMLRHPAVREKFHRLVLDDGEMNQRQVPDFIQECRRAGMEVEQFSTFRERAFGKVMLGHHLIHELSFRASDSLRALSRLRRLRDLVLATVGLLVTLPLSLVIAAAIKCDSAGPVLFAQERVGKNGSTFRMLKFRSMYVADIPGSEDVRWTTRKNDPRVTLVGALMRRLHLDELPQLINVIKGDMSLVGPRPFHPLHVAELEKKPCFSLRQLVLPGITGWAQVRCDYSASLEDHEEVLARDLYYIKHAGLLLDLLIIADTFRVCLWRRGAC